MARIIIVDDDEIVAEIVNEALAAAGHMVNSVHDGTEALAAIYAGEPDLVILDYELPDGTGLDILRHIRLMPRGTSTLVIMLTARRSRLLQARAEHTGANDYIVKPFRPEHLVQRVEDLLAAKIDGLCNGLQ